MVKKVKELTPAEVIASEDALMDFQFAVIDALNSKGITQVEFAEMLGVSRARVSQMLSSDANPTIKLVGRALYLLGLKPAYNELVATDAVEEPQEIALEAFAGMEAAEPEVDWQLAETATEGNQIGGALRHGDDGFRWWAHQHHKSHDVWRNRRVSANYNGHKKLAAA